MEEQILTSLIAAFAGNPLMLLLCVVLVGVGYVTYKFGNKVLESIVTRVDKLDARLEGIEDKLTEIVSVRKDVEHIKERVTTIEGKCSRRHES